MLPDASGLKKQSHPSHDLQPLQLKDPRALQPLHGLARIEILEGLGSKKWKGTGPQFREVAFELASGNSLLWKIMLLLPEYIYQWADFIHFL